MTDLPDLPAGVWRHYRGPLYLVLGYGHDADADVLGWARTPGSTYYTPFNGVRNVVVYVGLELDGAHTGPRLAVRTAEWFQAFVCAHAECEASGRVAEGDFGRYCGVCHFAAVRRFTYVGPSWDGQD